MTTFAERRLFAREPLAGLITHSGVEPGRPSSLPIPLGCSTQFADLVAHRSGRCGLSVWPRLCLACGAGRAAWRRWVISSGLVEGVDAGAVGRSLRRGGPG